MMSDLLDTHERLRLVYQRLSCSKKYIASYADKPAGRAKTVSVAKLICFFAHDNRIEMFEGLRDISLLRNPRL